MVRGHATWVTRTSRQSLHSQAPVSGKKRKGISPSLSSTLLDCPSARVRCHFLNFAVPFLPMHPPLWTLSCAHVRSLASFGSVHAPGFFSGGGQHQWLTKAASPRRGTWLAPPELRGVERERLVHTRASVPCSRAIRVRRRGSPGPSGGESAERRKRFAPPNAQNSRVHGGYQLPSFLPAWPAGGRRKKTRENWLRRASPPIPENAPPRLYYMRRYSRYSCVGAPFWRLAGVK